MNNDISFLITILYNDTLIKCALKINFEDLHPNVYTYPMESESRAILHKLLPEHVRSCGPIVDVDTDLFDIVVIHENESAAEDVVEEKEDVHQIEVDKIYNNFYGNSPTRSRIDGNEIYNDKSTAKLNTITSIELVLDSIKHEDNRMYTEIEFWNKCLELAHKLCN